MALINREVILAKIESTYNTDPTPSAANDAVLVEGPSWAHENASMIERPSVKTTIGKRQSVFGGTLKSVSFDVELKGSGAAGTAPEIGQLLRACSMDETIVPSTSVTYAPVSSSQESITLYYYEDGVLHIITGARGTCSITLESKGKGMINFTFTGHEVAPTDTALVTPTYDSTVPPPIISVPFSMGGYSSVISSLSMDVGNTISMPADMSAADGFGEILITARDTGGSFDPARVALSAKNYISEWKNGTLGSLTTGVIGSTAGNRYQLTCGQAYYKDVGQGEREGLRIYEIGFGAAESSGDDEFSLVFT